MPLPWTDWQFWVVSVVALWGVVAIVRAVVPRRAESTAACEKCESGGGVGMEAGPKLVDLGRREGSPE